MVLSVVLRFELSMQISLQSILLFCPPRLTDERLDRLGLRGYRASEGLEGLP